MLVPCFMNLAHFINFVVADLSRIQNCTYIWLVMFGLVNIATSVTYFQAVAVRMSSSNASSDLKAYSGLHKYSHIVVIT